MIRLAYVLQTKVIPQLNLFNKIVIEQLHTTQRMTQ